MLEEVREDGESDPSSRSFNAMLNELCFWLFDNTTHCVGDVTDTRKLRNDFKSDTGFNIKHEIFYVYGKDILNVGTLWSNKSGVEQPDIERFGDIKQCETSNPAPSLNDLIAGFAGTMYNDGTMDLKHTPYNGIPIVIETVDSCSKLTYNYSIRIAGVAYALSKLFPVPISKHTVLRTILVSKACASRAVEQCSKLLNKFVECEVCNHCKAAELSPRLVNKRKEVADVAEGARKVSRSDVNLIDEANIKIETMVEEKEDLDDIQIIRIDHSYTTYEEVGNQEKAGPLGVGTDENVTTHNPQESTILEPTLEKEDSPMKHNSNTLVKQTDAMDSDDSVDTQLAMTDAKKDGVENIAENSGTETKDDTHPKDEGTKQILENGDKAANDAGATEDTKKDNETPTASEKQYDEAVCSTSSANIETEKVQKEEMISDKHVDEDGTRDNEAGEREEKKENHSEDENEENRSEQEEGGEIEGEYRKVISKSEPSEYADERFKWICEHIVEAGEEYAMSVQLFEKKLKFASIHLQVGLFRLRPWNKAILEVFAKLFKTKKQDMGLVYCHMRYLQETNTVQRKADMSYIFNPDHVEFLRQTASVKCCKPIGFKVYSLTIGNDDIDYRYVKVDLSSQSVQITVNGWNYLVRLRPPFQETFRTWFELDGLLRVISKLTICNEKASMNCHILYRQDVLHGLNPKYYDNMLKIQTCCLSCRDVLESRGVDYRKLLCVYPASDTRTDDYYDLVTSDSLRSFSPEITTTI